MTNFQYIQDNFCCMCKKHKPKKLSDCDIFKFYSSHNKEIDKDMKFFLDEYNKCKFYEWKE